MRYYGKIITKKIEIGGKNIILITQASNENYKKICWAAGHWLAMFPLTFFRHVQENF